MHHRRCADALLLYGWTAMITTTTTATTTAMTQTTTPLFSYWSRPPYRTSSLRQRLHRHRRLSSPYFPLSAKKRRKGAGGAGDDATDSFYNWYDDVDDDASPGDVFREEMERRKLISQIGGGGEGGAGGEGGMEAAPDVGAGVGVGVGGGGGMMSGRYGGGAGGMTAEEERSVEATLASYAAYAVQDNWLDEDYLNLMEGQAPEGADDDELDNDNDEPWEQWGDDKGESKGGGEDPEVIDGVLRLDPQRLKSLAQDMRE